MRYQLKLIGLSLLILLVSSCSNAEQPAQDIAPIDDLNTAPTLENTPSATTPTEESNDETVTDSSTNNLESAITFKLSGGIVGFCDTLLITANGEFLLEQPCHDYQLSGNLLEGDMETFQGALTTFTSFEIEETTDGLTTQLSFKGQGDAEPDEEQKSALIDWANSMLIRMQPPPTPPPAPDPVQVGAEGLCPNITRPAMLIDNYESPYLIFAMDLTTQETCDIVLSQPPIGPIISAANNLYYPVFDEATKTKTIWELKLDGSQTPLEFTKVTVEEQTYPFNFMISMDGSKIAWSYTTIEEADTTETPLYRNNMWVANIDGSAQIQLLNQQENSEARYLAPVRFTTDSSTLYYALQPNGIGRGAFNFGGRFDNLYQIPIAGGDPTLRHACTTDQYPLCIGDISPDGSTLAYVDPETESINLVDANGAVLNSFQGPGEHYLGQPTFSPAGALGFLSITFTEATEETPPSPNPGTLSYVAAPYTTDPQTLTANNNIVGIWEWLDDNQLAYGVTTADTFSVGVSTVSLDGQVIDLSANFPLGVWR